MVYSIKGWKSIFGSWYTLYEVFNKNNEWIDNVEFSRVAQSFAIAFRNLKISMTGLVSLPMR